MSIPKIDAYLKGADESVTLASQEVDKLRKDLGLTPDDELLWTLHDLRSELWEITKRLNDAMATVDKVRAEVRR